MPEHTAAVGTLGGGRKRSRWVCDLAEIRRSPRCPKRALKTAPRSRLGVWVDETSTDGANRGEGENQSRSATKKEQEADTPQVFSQGPISMACVSTDRLDGVTVFLSLWWMVELVCPSPHDPSLSPQDPSLRSTEYGFLEEQI